MPRAAAARRRAPGIHGAEPGHTGLQPGHIGLQRLQRGVGYLELCRQPRQVLRGEPAEDATVDVVAGHRLSEVCGQVFLLDEHQHPEGRSLRQHPQQPRSNEVHPLHVADGGIEAGEGLEHAAQRLQLGATRARLGTPQILFDLILHARIRRSRASALHSCAELVVHHRVAPHPLGAPRKRQPRLWPQRWRDPVRKRRLQPCPINVGPGGSELQELTPLEIRLRLRAIDHTRCRKPLLRGDGRHLLAAHG